MPNELERRLSTALDHPRPTRAATSRARVAALATLPPPKSRSAGWIVAFAAALAAGAVGLGAAALAATGKLHVVLGAPSAARAPVHLTVPRHSSGIALVAGGRLWLATRSGLRIEGMPVSAAELSPRALYAVVGVGRSLVALAPGRRHAWTHETAGRVVAAAWSPDGLKIAYVVRGGSATQLRMIEGDGDHDRLLDRHVAAVKPTWRSDSLAITYYRPRQVVALDFERGTRRVEQREPRAAAQDRAFSPGGDRVAVAVPRPGRVVELRVFGGLTIEEAAHVLNVSPSTAKRDLRTAKAWLRRELGSELRP